MDKNIDLSCRRNRVGGQAVIEGVMMKNGSDVALAVRKEDGSVEMIRRAETAQDYFATFDFTELFN